MLLEIENMGSAEGSNLIAFSGGVDSSLVAHAVHAVFPHTSEAVMALSPSVSQSMQRQAQQIVTVIGIPLRFVHTEEFNDPLYVANQGLSCYVCKSSIYAALRRIEEEAGTRKEPVCLYNGSNAEDASDPTRVGMRAASEYAVLSPLARFSKNEIREMSRCVGLPNWNFAASPCLRSRLHAGVPATVDHLKRIERAEETLRTLLQLPEQANFRVRHFPDDSAMIEIDQPLLELVSLERCREALLPMGFLDVKKRAFRSGSVSVELPGDINS
jgi:uncharacterized protein (TIGR00268 family)